MRNHLVGVTLHQLIQNLAFAGGQLVEKIARLLRLRRAALRALAGRHGFVLAAEPLSRGFAVDSPERLSCFTTSGNAFGGTDR